MNKPVTQMTMEELALNQLSASKYDRLSDKFKALIAKEVGEMFGDQKRQAELLAMPTEEAYAAAKLDIRSPLIADKVRELFLNIHEVKVRMTQTTNFDEIEEYFQTGDHSNYNDMMLENR